MANSQRLYDLNAACMLIVVSILLGAFYYQFGLHENPCPLCLLQRMGMIGVIVGLAMNMQLGFHRLHFAAVNVASLVGATFSIRQVLLHICPVTGEPTGFGEPMMGLHLYTWGVLIFAASILGSSILLTLVKEHPEESDRRPSLFEQIVFGLASLVCFVNVAATFAMCWFGPCCDDGPCP
ncbi:disulfide bond formation protein B [Blastopirellula retiformator]|uniref:Disulfide bond formation protein B n=1 Tax=Blastopirellula retiformator TaxID=2527970 RepID=A0A5C5V0T9_9BACT|nr:disulfide bond formation protein B [Blastopirellula retiformator]TWT31345.1 disulfide bond formation protein B [Blastopirellula retiformator]